MGHLYAAEALIHLGRIPEAVSHLTPDNVNSISTATNNGVGDALSGTISSLFLLA